MRVRELAAVRTGDKGDRVTITVIARNPAHYPHLANAITTELVVSRLAAWLAGPVQRHELPTLSALQFTCAGVYAGGVSSSTELDTHGKTYGHLLLDITI